MPAINIGDIQIQVQAAQNTTPSLKFMTRDGTIYYADAALGVCPNSLMVGDGTKNYTIGTSQLVYWAENIDSCETISLAAGCYTAYVMGGRGGDGGNNAGNGGNATVATYSFNLTATTDVYVFRGGDGNAGGANASSGGIYSGGGGGASGAPSFIQVGTEYVISQGGDGGAGGGGYNNSKEEQECGAGGGGSATNAGSGLSASGTDSIGNDGFVCGGGGGGSLGGSGGATTSGFLYNGLAGTDATDTTGGTGGDSSMAGLFGSSRATGGAGGANVSWSCGGQMIYSYGGGVAARCQRVACLGRALA